MSSFASELRTLGPANFLYSDGVTLFAHGHRRKHADTGRVEAPGLVMLHRRCDRSEGRIALSGLSVRADCQDVILFASVPLTNERWFRLKKANWSLWNEVRWPGGNKTLSDRYQERLCLWGLK